MGGVGKRVGAGGGEEKSILTEEAGKQTGFFVAHFHFHSAALCQDKYLLAKDTGDRRDDDSAASKYSRGSSPGALASRWVLGDVIVTRKAGSRRCDHALHLRLFTQTTHE